MSERAGAFYREMVGAHADYTDSPPGILDGARRKLGSDDLRLSIQSLRGRDTGRVVNDAFAVYSLEIAAAVFAMLGGTEADRHRPPISGALRRPVTGEIVSYHKPPSWITGFLGPFSIEAVAPDDLGDTLLRLLRQGHEKTIPDSPLNTEVFLVTSAEARKTRQGRCVGRTVAAHAIRTQITSIGDIRFIQSYMRSERIGKQVASKHLPRLSAELGLM